MSIHTRIQTGPASLDQDPPNEPPPNELLFVGGVTAGGLTGTPSKPLVDGLVGGCTLGVVDGRGLNPLPDTFVAGLVADNGIRLGRPPGKPRSSTLALDDGVVGFVAEPRDGAAPNGEGCDRNGARKPPRAVRRGCGATDDPVDGPVLPLTVVLSGCRFCAELDRNPGWPKERSAARATGWVLSSTD